MQIFEFVPNGRTEGKVTAWLHGNADDIQLKERKRPAMIICPGGGYTHVSEREAEPVAEMYFAAGYQTFLLEYTVQEKAKDFRPLCQLASTIAQIRENADAWGVHKDKIAVSGFSAGGHLACSLGTLFNEEKFQKVFANEAYIRPDAMVLAYPVITSDVYTHTESLCNVSGAEEGSEEYRWFGLEAHVDSETPPAFLWHTAEDASVPVENSLRMAQALSREKIPFELHIFPEGCHGMSVCTREVETESEYNARWVEWSIRWLNKLFGYVK